MPVVGSGLMLFVEDRGRGEAVVLLHGTPTTPDHLRPLAERLARRWRTLLVHLPGYGRSGPLAPYDVARSHALVEEALAALHVSEAHLLGHSGGAYRALALATRLTVRPLSVVCLGAVAWFPAATQKGFSDFAALLRAGTDVGPSLPSMMLGAPSRDVAACVDEVKSWAKACAPEHLANELEAFNEAPDLRDEIATLDVPILLRVGALDAATPPHNSTEIAAAARRSTLQIIDGVGHALLSEDFDATAAAVEAHLASAASAE